jgi:predicted  nucleic acid-binding Zn-ribbon protein
MEDPNAPATKADITAVKADITAVKADITAVKADITAVKQDIGQLRSEVKQDIEQLRSEVNHGYNDLVERMADAETRLLKAFYDFAQSNHQRVTLLEGNEAGIRSRLATLEDRLLQVEKRLNMPPAA